MRLTGLNRITLIHITRGHSSYHIASDAIVRAAVLHYHSNLLQAGADRKMKVFITSATGYVGQEIAKKLIAEGHTVGGRLSSSPILFLLFLICCDQIVCSTYHLAAATFR